MRLERLELYDICQHREAQFNFAPGLNGLLGPNGSGKSNILKAIQAAITGEFKNAGVKDENVYNGPDADPRRAAYIRLVLTHGEARLDITRGFRKKQTQLVVTGQPDVVIGDIKVTKAITDLLQTDLKLLADYVFVGQGRISDFIDQAAAERAATFQTLFGTKPAAGLYKLFGERLGQIVLTDRSEERKLTATRLEILQQELAQFTAELEGYADLAAYRPAEDQNQQFLQRYQAEQAARQQLAGVNEECARISDELAPVRQQREEALQQADEIRQRLAAAEPDVVQAQEAYRQWERHQQHQAALDKAKLALQQLQPPVAPPRSSYQPSETLQEELRQVQSEAEALQAFTDTFNVGEDTCECPTCGTRVSGLQSRITAALDRLDELDMARGKLTQLLQVSLGYERRVQQHEQTLAAYEARRETLTANVAQLQAGLGTAPDIRNAEAILATCNADWQQVNALDALAQARHVTVSRLEGTLTALLTQQAQLQAVLAQPLSERVVERARLTLQRTQARLAARSELLGKQSRCRREVDSTAEHLQHLDQLVAQDRRTLAWREHLTVMRGVVHHEALPRTVATHHLTELSQDVNDVLLAMDLPFVVEATEDLRFTAIFRDGKVSQAARLSGGQKILLAIAFRVAVNAAFTGDLGLLCLDEPTEFLDRDNVQNLRVALQKLKELSAARGLQCLMVTHEQSLLNLFDAVVTLS